MDETEEDDPRLRHRTSTWTRTTTTRWATTPPLISGGIVDSFSMVSLKRFLEKKYDISIPDADASPEAFDTVNSIAALVQRFQQA